MKLNFPISGFAEVHPQSDKFVLEKKKKQPSMLLWTTPSRRLDDCLESKCSFIVRHSDGATEPSAAAAAAVVLLLLAAGLGVLCHATQAGWLPRLERETGSRLGCHAAVRVGPTLMIRNITKATRHSALTCNEMLYTLALSTRASAAHALRTHHNHAMHL